MSICDSREPDSITSQLVKQGWQLAALSHGDYQLACGLDFDPIVERKTISNFLSDMQDGTLTRQARSLAESTPFPILLLEGVAYLAPDNIHLRGSRVTKQQFRNQLMSLQNLGLRLEHTDNIADTIERLTELVEYYSKDKHESVQRQVSGDYRIACLTLIPGIGESKAKALLARLPTLKAIACADVQTLTDCEGIGYVLAERIHRWWMEGKGEGKNGSLNE
jgi:ERCC4-type nuclease